jgi:diguanylate cyclase
VISLKRHIEASAEELAKTVLSAYQAALGSMAKACTQAVPHIGGGLTQKLAALQKNISPSMSADDMAAIQQCVDKDLATWAESAGQYSEDKANEVKEIMVAVAAAAAAVGERDQRYANQFSGLTTRLHSIAKLEDLTKVRRSVLESATELKSAVKKMAEDGEQSLSQLRAEVANYRSKLAQSEQREAVDPLTGLASRREIDAQIEERISWRQSFCLAVLDLNGFKWINDIHGHVAGDDLLKQFAAELKARVNGTDAVGRWGGDEFVVVIDADLSEAKTRMERIRDWVFGNYNINRGNDTVEVTLKASIGIAAWDGTESAVELLARADRKMYAEKKVAGATRPAYA